MKKILLLIITVVPLLVIAQTQIWPGPVSGTWDFAGSPYMVNGEIVINETTSLTIEPGVEVGFAGWYQFFVSGSLMANGTEADSILFTANVTTVRWHGIRFINNSDSSILDYCIIEYGLTDMDGANFPDNSGGGILLLNSPDASIMINNSVIQHNEAYYGGGIECDNANPIIENCHITYNTAVYCGGAMQLYSDCSPVIKNSTLAYNYSTLDGGAVECDMGCSPEFIDNSIIHNTAGQWGGGFCLNYAAGPEFIGNSITHNTAGDWGGGFCLAHVDGFIAKRNLIAYNSAKGSGGIDFYYSAGELLSNNTIVYNTAGDWGGGGIGVDPGCIPSFTSDILYFNHTNGLPDQVRLADSTSIPSFRYCDIQDSTAGFSGPGGASFSGTYLNCIDSDPLFADTLNDDFSLTWENYPQPDSTRSPCIDAGIPGFPDPDSTRNDIGAYYFFQQLDIPEALDPVSITSSSFIAVWSSAFGAIGYHLDVALDDAFTNLVYDNIEIVGDTTYFVDGLDESTTYYYRANSYNNALTSIYSNTQSVSTYAVSVEESDNDAIEIYSSHHNVFVNINQTITSPGEIKIYNTVGRLLTHQQIYSGSNTIDPGVTDQIIIVKVIVEGKVYHKKLLID